MSITNEQSNLQLSYEPQPYESQNTAVMSNDANISLQDWRGYENFFVSIKGPTGSEMYNVEAEIDVPWTKIARSSIERWSKENPY